MEKPAPDYEGMAGKVKSTWAEGEAANFLDGAATFRSRIVVTARRLTEDTDWTSSGGSVLSGKQGDWLVSDGVDSWTVKSDIFLATYREVGDQRFAKVAPIEARQMEEAASIQTLEGVADARVGDWLVRNPSGEVWPVPNDVFTQRYELA